MEEIEIVITETNRPRFTFTPTRTTLKYSPSIDEVTKEKLLLAAKQITEELGTIVKSWRGRINPVDLDSIVLQNEKRTESKKFDISNLKLSENLSFIRHQDLLDIGFVLRGVEEDDPFYQITFKHPFKFDISSLSGVLEEGVFWLYANNTRYSDITSLKKVIDVVGSEVYKFS